MAFVQRTTAPTSDEAVYFADNPFYQAGYGMPNCTAYAYGRFWEILGSKPKLSTGNAGEWYDYTSDGYARGQTPRLGAVAVWKNPGEAGHVAIVEKINSDGSILISQSAWGGTFWWTQALEKGYAFGGSYVFQGFIYNPGSIPEPISKNDYLTQAEMQNNAIYIYWYLIQRGWTLNAIAGMLGNMQVESTINPGIWQDLDEGNTNVGFGLVQWTPASNYINWCNTQGYDYTEMDSNLQRILYELSNNLQWIETEQSPMSFSEFTQSTETARQLAYVFMRNYERPGDLKMLERGENAWYWYNYLLAVAEGGTPVTPGGNKKKKKGFNFILFNQRRKRTWTDSR